MLLERFFEITGYRDEKLLTYARELDRHYIPSRHPKRASRRDAHEAYDEETARRALTATRHITEFVGARLGKKA